MKPVVFGSFIPHLNLLRILLKRRFICVKGGWDGILFEGGFLSIWLFLDSIPGGFVSQRCGYLGGNGGDWLVSPYHDYEYFLGWCPGM